MKLKKCCYGVSAGKFLGYMLLERGIELNPNKFWAPNVFKDIQKLNGRLAEITRFMAKLLRKLYLFQNFEKG